MSMAALFILALNWQQTKCLSTGEWINKMWYRYAMEYYLIFKKEQATDMWNNLDKTQKHVKWNKPDTKDCRSHDTI